MKSWSSANVKIQQDVYAESTQGDEKERESESKGERERAKKARPDVLHQRLRVTLLSLAAEPPGKRLFKLGC